MRLINRFVTVYRARGPLGFARFLGTRIARRQRDVLFARTLVPGTASADGTCLHSVIVIDRNNMANAEIAPIKEQVFAGDSAEYLPGIQMGDIAFAHADPAGQVITFAFVLYRTFYKRLLGVPDSTPLIGNCFTVPAMRGRGLYPAMLRTVCQHLAGLGHDRVFISCAPDNQASIRGIERAGFCRTRDIQNTVVLSRIVIARTERPADCRNRDAI